MAEGTKTKIQRLLSLMQDLDADPVILRGDISGRIVVLAPTLMGRVMCCGFDGEEGASNGYVLEEQLREGFSKSGEGAWNNFGGEERLWFGPDGGAFGLQFKPGPQIYENYFLPPAMNDQQYELFRTDEKSATFGTTLQMTNVAGHRICLKITREVSILERSPYEAGSRTLECVGFVSKTTAENVGDEPLTRQTGPFYLWTPGQFDCSDHTIIMAPIQAGNVEERGEPFCMDYIPKVCPGGKMDERFWSIGEDRVLIKASGRAQTKIDFWKRRSLGRLGAVDLEKAVLTCVDVAVYDDMDYAAGYWLPYDGDPYDGAVMSVFVLAGDIHTQGIPLFYELEGMSPALFLAPGESFCHESRTAHLRGERRALATVCERDFHADETTLVEFDRQSQ